MSAPLAAAKISFRTACLSQLQEPILEQTPKTQSPARHREDQKVIHANCIVRAPKFTLGIQTACETPTATYANLQQ